MKAGSPRLRHSSPEIFHTAAPGLKLTVNFLSVDQAPPWRMPEGVSQMPEHFNSDAFRTVLVRDEALPFVNAVLGLAAWCFRYRKRSEDEEAGVSPLPTPAADAEWREAA